METQKSDYFPVSPKKKLLAYLLKCGQILLWTPGQIGNAANKLLIGLGHLRFQLTCPIRPDDIFIATYPKSGTTWMQMILYQLTTNGNMRFKHILQKSPFWDEMTRWGNTPLQYSRRRFFKTHLQYKYAAQYPCKYIYIVRDYRDVAVSFYHHYTNLMGFRGDFDEFFNRVFLKGGYADCNWFEHVHGWHRNPKKLDILYLKYEDMKKDLPGVIRRVIKFCGFDVDEARFRRVVERSSFAFMKQHEEKFDPSGEIILQRGINPGQFLRKGEVGGWQNYFKEAQLEECGKLYRQWIPGEANLPYEA